MGAVQRKTLSIVLALSLALSMLGAAGLQLIGAGTAHAVEVLGTNLVYENVYGLVKPSYSDCSYAVMWNEAAVEEYKYVYNSETRDYDHVVTKPATEDCKIVRSDGKVTMTFKDADTFDEAGNVFYGWDGLLALKTGVYTLDGKQIAVMLGDCTFQGCKLSASYWPYSPEIYYDRASKLLLSWAGDSIAVCKNDGTLMQAIPMPNLPGGPESGDVDLWPVKDKNGSAIKLQLYLCYTDITQDAFDQTVVPDDGWAVETNRWWSAEKEEIWDGDGYVPNPAYTGKGRGSGHMTLAYGLRYDSATGTYQKVKLDGSSLHYESNETWWGLEQAERMTDGSEVRTLYEYNSDYSRHTVTNAADTEGTPLLVAGYPVGAQKMEGNNTRVGGIGDIHPFPQNTTTGLFFAYKNGKYGVIDALGNVKVPFEYDKFCNNTFSKTSVVLMQKGGAWSFIDLAEQAAEEPEDPAAPATQPSAGTQKPTASSKKSIANAQVTVKNKVYSGKKLKPSSVTVKLNGKKLKKGTDYTVTCKGGKKIGPYKVTVTGKGKYTGKAAGTFVVTPKAVAIKKASPFKRGFTANWKKPAKKYLKQTSGYQVRWSTDKSLKKRVKSKLVKSKKKSTLKVGHLRAKKTYYLQVRSYKTVDGVKYFSDWSKTVKVKTKAKKTRR